MNEPELLEALKRSMVALRQVKQRLRELEDAAREPIAVVGMACRFAGGASSPDALWDLVSRGIDAITEVPGDRWDVDEFYDPDPAAAGKMVTRSAGFIGDIYGFDSAFFGIAPREARRMDPQQRLLLEVAWEALEHGGIVPSTLLGSPTGVFVGVNTQEYATPHLGELGDLDGYVLTGTHASVASGRISYVMGLKGPSVTLDTACSSSLVATHLACQSLRSGETNIALAGGVGLLLAPTLHVEFSRLRGLAADGRCKSFDARADGMGWGEGCGVVVLKRLSDALRAGDRVHAVIRGSAVNQDGRSNGLTAPNGPSQEAVIARALERAGVSPADVGYVEAHGAGTPLGDPIEAQALGAALARGRSPAAPALLGSVKSNIGHTMAAAGVAGLIKTVMLLQHRVVPRSLHFVTPSAHIPWDVLPLKVPTEATPWPSEGRARIAGVSSFGVSGTNAHVIVEEAPEPPAAAPSPAAHERGAHLLVVSAKTPEALPLQAERYAAHLAAHPSVPFADTCFSAALTRTHFEERLAVVAPTAEEARARLLSVSRGEVSPGTARGVATGRRPKIAFLFTGQGSQYVGMGRDLYEAEPVFRDALDRCARVLDPLLPRPLLPVIYGPEGGGLDETLYTQPALFAVEYALAQLWQSWGIVPDALMGHSVGEYVAACLAGVFSLEDGLTLIAARGRLMHALPPEGEMASVKCDAARVAKLLEGELDVSIGGYNGPEAVVISGRREAVRAVCRKLDEQGVKTKLLAISIASHSPLMEPMLDEFERIAAGLHFHAPKVAVVSNLTGHEAGKEIAAPAYWRNHIREAVRFEQGMKAIRALGVDTFLEAGPQSTLLGMGAGCLAGEECAWLPSLKKDTPSWQILLESLGKLHVAGAEVDWRGLDAPFSRQRVALPTYAFDRQPYRVDRPRGAGDAGAKTDGYALAGARLDVPGDAIHCVVKLGPAQQAYLGQHRVHGQVAVPGSLYLSVLLALASEVFGAQAATLRDFQLLRPLIVSRETALHVVLEPGATGELAVRFCTSQASDGKSKTWLDHAQGTLILDARSPSSSAPRAVPSCPIEEPVEGLFARLESMQVAMGPGWRWLDSARSGEGAGFVSVKAPGGATNAEAPLHPTLLDNCLAASLLTFPRGDAETPYLLWGIRELRWYGGAALVASSFARRAASGEETRTADLVILDAAEEVLLEADGLTFKRAERSAFAGLAGAEASSMFTVEWTPREAAPVDPSGHWIVATSDAASGARLADRLRGTGATVTVGGMTDLTAMLAVLEKGPAGIVCWWRSSETGRGDDAARARARLLEASQVVRTLASPQAAGAEVLWVTEGAQCLTAGEGARVDLAPLWGLGRAAAQERPASRLLLVDVEAGEGAAIEGVWAAIRSRDDEVEVGFRGGRRFVARLVHAKPEAAASAAPIRSDGTVLVTGGLGGLGLRIAECLVEHRGARHLVLVGRSAASAERTARIEALRAKGATVAVAQADVADLAQVRALLASIPSDAPLRVVVHAAGVAGSAPVVDLDDARLSAIFAPKAQGAWNLHVATAGMPLDYFVLFSSIQAVVGSATQGGYAAANAFLDALAHQRRSEGLIAQSLNWGAWAGEGMASRLDETERVRLARAGFGMITADEGIRLFERAIDRSEPQLMLARLDVVAMQKVLADEPAEPIFRALVRSSPRRPSKVERPLRERLRGLPLSERERILTERIRAEAAAALRLSGPAALSLDQPLKQLGLDSLMALEIPNRLKAVTGEPFAATLLYDHPTVRALSAFVLRKMGLADEAPAAPSSLRRSEIVREPPSGEAKRSETSAALDAATDEQLFSLIDDDASKLG
ncbi:MAG TPA: SDR family NAD(P)-dependent oxidoreductase [Polyangiaceae bacterium]|jgi:acyl transferase domain-containing protein